jgi:hypothetical protein
MTDHENGPPIEVEGRTTPHHQGGRPSTDQLDTDTEDSNSTCQQMRARRAASWRLPVIDCGRSDPWRYPEPGERGYGDAAAHLLALGLTPAPNAPALRAMWKAGNESRHAAQVVAERWGLVA